LRPFDGARVGRLPRPLQAGGERRFEAADGVFEQAADPFEGRGLIMHEARFDRPFEALRIGVGADRQRRAGELQQASQREGHLNS
jgi:hypothetical protein